MSNHNEKTPAHLAYQTQASRTGQVNMVNRKPYRTKAQKELARSQARKDSDGTYRTTAPVSYHQKAQSR
jgi:hypothetical protein